MANRTEILRSSRRVIGTQNPAQQRPAAPDVRLTARGHMARGSLRCDSCWRWVDMLAEGKCRACKYIDEDRTELSVMERRRRQWHGRRDRRYRKMKQRRPEVCAHCGTAENITIDHIVPMSKGGTDDLANLQFLCGPCNVAKGDR